VIRTTHLAMGRTEPSGVIELSKRTGPSRLHLPSDGMGFYPASSGLWGARTTHWTHHPLIFFSPSSGSFFGFLSSKNYISSFHSRLVKPWYFFSFLFGSPSPHLFPTVEQSRRHQRRANRSWDAPITLCLVELKPLGDFHPRSTTSHRIYYQSSIVNMFEKYLCLSILSY